MTTPSDPRGPVPDADELDELASALVDGEATVAERARAEEPAIAARVTAFRAVARIAGTPVEPLDDVARARVIRAAIAAASDPPAAAPVRRVPTWSAPAAAAVLVVLAGLGLAIAAVGGDNSDETASDAGTGTEATAFAEDLAERAGGSAGAEGGGEASPTADAPTAAAALPAADLGAHGDLASLEATLRARSFPTSAGGDASGRSAVLDASGCGGEVDGEALVEAARAELAGRPVVVAVLRRPDDGLAYRALDAATCELVGAGDL